MDSTCHQQFPEHLRLVATQWEGALADSGFDLVVVAAGQAQHYLFDDMAPFFRPNPHFALWFPSSHCEGAVLLFKPGHRPKLYFLQPRDYWRLSPEVPEWADAHCDLAVFEAPEPLAQELRADAGAQRAAFIGGQLPPDLPATHNPASLLSRLHYQRAWKTGFEIACLSQASGRAVKGHMAARDAYFAGGAEFDILGAYLASSGQTESDLPYPCIIGLGQHAAVLHYQHYDRQRPGGSTGFLIDAGATHCGYGSDVTRTWPNQGSGRFAELIGALDEQQRSLIDTIRPSVSYIDLHLAMHQRISGLLHRFGLVNCSADAAFEQRISQAFMPHGLGHLLGLQTHDVGGHQTSPDGDLTPPPKGHETLRLTRTLEAGMVFTIEPGLYFIPMLLEALRAGSSAQAVNWPAIDAWMPCGGVRVEDNVLVTAEGVRNLTREAFAAETA